MLLNYLLFTKPKPCKIQEQITREFKPSKEELCTLQMSIYAAFETDIPTSKLGIIIWCHLTFLFYTNSKINTSFEIFGFMKHAFEAKVDKITRILYYNHDIYFAVTSINIGGENSQWEWRLFRFCFCFFINEIIEIST